jgi:transcriptional regulator with XRE-family HTH domain
MITGAQCRAARSFLGWSVKELAAKARVSPNTIVRLENGKGTTIAATQVVLKQTLEAAGIRFTKSGGVEPSRKDGAKNG